MTTTWSSSNSGDSVVGSCVEHVERGAGDHAVADAFGELGLDDDPAAGDVDHAQRRLGLEQQLAVDQAGRLLVLRQVDREEVARRHDLIERHQLDAHLAGAVGGHERVVGDEAHLERLGAVGDELADPAEADDAERLVGELDALPARPLPAAGGERGVRLRHVAGLGEQQRDRVLGGGDDVRLRGVDHHHAAGGGGGDVDVVEPDAGAADDDQLGAGVEHVGRDLGGRADDQGVRRGHDSEQLLGREVGADVDGVPRLTEPIEPTVGDLFGDQNSRHDRHAYRPTAPDPKH